MTNYPRQMFNRVLCVYLYALFCISISTSALAQRDPNKVLTYEHFLGQTPNTGAVKSFELNASVSKLTIAGAKPTTLWSYNKKVPGPVLRVQQGDQVKITFRNNLPEPTTTHWHGMRVPNAMDGVPGVTQAPVAPGGTFVYQFQALDAGTYWFHPHMRSHEQVERGLYGVLIVESIDDPVYDQEWVWVLDDWLLTSQGAVEDSFGVRDLDTGGRLGNVLTINGKNKPAFEAKAGERIRIRIINASNARNYKLDFGAAVSNKEGVIFAVDGNLTALPLQINGFEIAPGNRIDIDLTVPTGNIKRIPIVNTFFHREARGNVSTGLETLATINIVGQTQTPKSFDIPKHERMPNWSSAHQLPIDYSYDFSTKINFGFLWNGGPTVHFVINEKRYGEHEVTQLKHRKFYHLRFTNGTGLYHPIHLHGMFFKVLSRNGVQVNEPFFRDTALLDYDGSIEIGVVPVDLGKWMLHCHLLEHSALGMMTLVEVTEKSKKPKNQSSSGALECQN